VEILTRHQRNIYPGKSIDGGTLIEYEDENPRIRQDFGTTITKVGARMEMPVFQYAGV
jgi:hypothetical protein